MSGDFWGCFLCVGFNKACKELQTHQHLLEERENELQEQAFDRRDRHDDDDDDDGGESFQLHTPMACDVEDMDMTRQVTSTSIDPKHKRKSSILMVSQLYRYSEMPAWWFLHA